MRLMFCLFVDIHLPDFSSLLLFRFVAIRMNIAGFSAFLEFDRLHLDPSVSVGPNRIRILDVSVNISSSMKQPRRVCKYRVR